MPISSFQAVLKDILIVFLHPIILYPSMHHHPTSQQLVSVYPMLHCVMALEECSTGFDEAECEGKISESFSIDDDN